MIQNLKWIYRAWRYRLRLERQEIAWLLCNLQAGQTAVDIGAHKGAYTWWMANRVTPAGRVFAFEPQPDLANQLRTLVSSRGLEFVKVEQMGVSRFETEMQLRVPARGNSPGASFENTRDALGGQPVSVHVTSLDQYFVPLVQPIHLIKCDTEGHELQVFRGGERILRTHRPLLLFECEARHRGAGSTGEVFNYLAELGYSGSFFCPSGIRPISEFDEASHQSSPGSTGYVNNFVFIHESAS
ncbi:MAG: FkbM family methyltransferase [Xanthomonadales bacterium]|nr:FkbM family methyltransferase [Xanthomonadales bacterium]NNL94823.1 FkbM family methyltransferase [Xanthomonadales bacterium]